MWLNAPREMPVKTLLLCSTCVTINSMRDATDFLRAQRSDDASNKRPDLNTYMYTHRIDSSCKDTC